jgi:hypothetical protein
MLTEDMTRLSSEIGGLRRKRAGLIQQLVNGSQQRHKSVAEFRSNANCNFKAAASALRAKRTSGLDQLRREVSSVRQAVSEDLKGVRRAWAGEGRNHSVAFGGRSSFGRGPSPKGGHAN